MNYYCAVEVEHVRYARFLPLDQARKRSMELTTLADNQRRAEVNLYLMRGEERIFLYTFTLDPLPQKPAGAPRIVLHGDFDGRHTLRVDIKVDGSRYGGTEISLRRYLPRSRRPYLLLLLIPAAVVLFGSFLLARSCLSPAVSGGPSPEPEKTEEQSEEQRDTYGGEENGTEGTAEESTEEQSYAATEDAASPDETAQQEEQSASGEESAAAADQDTEAADRESAAADQAAAEKPEERGGAPNTEKPAAAPQEKTVYFPPDSARLTDNVKEKLRELVPTLRNIQATRVEIAGHCALYGTEQGRMGLSADRARAVYRYLQRSGWNPEDKPNITWYGGKQPVTEERDEQRLNRRVEIRVSSSAQ